MNRIRILGATVGALLTGMLAPAQTPDRGELDALRQQVQQLEQQIKVISRKLELKDEEAAAAASSAGKVVLTDKSITVVSAENDNFFKLRGLAQLDSRMFFGDAGTANNVFLLRRARLINEAQFARSFGYQI